jgi:predicted Zn-dependent protease
MFGLRSSQHVLSRRTDISLSGIPSSSPRPPIQPTRTHAFAFLSFVFFAAATACATNPATGQKQFTLMSESQEIAIGREMDPQVRQEFGVYDDPELDRYVEDIGARLASQSERPNLPWQFTIVDSPAINAFALPGGFIYVTRGLLAYLGSESALAGVLGHEVAHVTARHAAEQYTRATSTNIGMTMAAIFLPGFRPFYDLAGTGLGLMFLKYGRDDELQADRLGAGYAKRAGWDPGGVVEMLTTLARIDEATDRRGMPNWMATHPEPASRVNEVQSVVAQLRADGNGSPEEDRRAYLHRVEGLAFGDDPSEGVVRGDAFLHPGLRFALQFPEGWEITNGREQVVAQQPGEQVFLFLQTVDNQSGRSLEDIAVRTMAAAGLRLVNGGMTRVNGIETYTGTFEGRVRDLGDTRARGMYLIHNRAVYRLVGLAPRDAFARVAEDFDRTFGTFRALSSDEAANIRANRIGFYTVRSGDSWQSIAQGPSQANVKASTLAIMNGYPPNEQPQPGTRIKVVVSG